MNADRPRRDEPVLETLPADAEGAPAAFSSAWGLFEVLLKAPDRLNPYARLPALQPRLSMGFTVITLVGLGAYALLLYAALLYAQPEARPTILQHGWDGGAASAAGLLAAYPAGVLLATAVVLPTYWFLGLLFGVKMPLGEVLTHTLKGKAATTVLVLGIAPIYAVVVGCLILLKVPAEMLNLALWLGLLLPFVAALRGAGAIQAGFESVVATTPDLSAASRASVPTSLMLLWAALFTLTAPVVMWKAWDLTTAWLGG